MNLEVEKVFDILGLGVVAAIGLHGVANSYFKVEEGQEAIVDNRFLGYKDKVYSEGTHSIIPWIETPIIYDSWTRPRLVEGVVSTSTLGKVLVGMEVLMHPRDGLPPVFRALGRRHYEGKLNAYTKISLVEATGFKYSTSQFYSEKESISREIQQSLSANVARFGMVIDKVSIYNITVGEDIDEMAVFLAGTNGAVYSSYTV